MTTTNENETTTQEESPAEQPSATELQSELAARDERVSALEEQVITLERDLSSTVSRYRLALLDAAPEVPGDLVNGATAEELETSLAKAKGVVEQVRTRLLESMDTQSQNADDASRQDTERSSGSGIPAGAPPRSGSDDSTSADLTPRDKIALGLERL